MSAFGGPALQVPEDVPDESDSESSAGGEEAKESRDGDSMDSNKKDQGEGTCHGEKNISMRNLRCCSLIFFSHDRNTRAKKYTYVTTLGPLEPSRDLKLTPKNN